MVREKIIYQREENQESNRLFGYFANERVFVDFGVSMKRRQIDPYINYQKIRRYCDLFFRNAENKTWGF